MCDFPAVRVRAPSPTNNAGSLLQGYTHPVAPIRAFSHTDMSFLVELMITLYRTNVGPMWTSYLTDMGFLPQEYRLSYCTDAGLVSHRCEIPTPHMWHSFRMHQTFLTHQCELSCRTDGGFPPNGCGLPCRKDLEFLVARIRSSLPHGCRPSATQKVLTSLPHFPSHACHLP